MASPKCLTLHAYFKTTQFKTANITLVEDRGRVGIDNKIFRQGLANAVAGTDAPQQHTQQERKA